MERRHRVPGSAATSTREVHRIGWFVLVGALAALVHWLVVVGLVRALDLHPLVANVGGWLVAFGVSFTGHHRLTFGGHGAALGTAARRFLVVSFVGFAVNELAYAVLLHGTGLRYDLVLAAVLLGVAGMTYLLGRRWAFAESPAPAARRRRRGAASRAPRRAARATRAC